MSYPLNKGNEFLSLTAITALYDLLHDDCCITCELSTIGYFQSLLLVLLVSVVFCWLNNNLADNLCPFEEQIRARTEAAFHVGQQGKFSTLLLWAIYNFFPSSKDQSSLICEMCILVACSLEIPSAKQHQEQGTIFNAFYLLIQTWRYNQFSYLGHDWFLLYPSIVHKKAHMQYSWWLDKGFKIFL